MCVWGGGGHEALLLGQEAPPGAGPVIPSPSAARQGCHPLGGVPATHPATSRGSQRRRPSAQCPARARAGSCCAPARRSASPGSRRRRARGSSRHADPGRRPVVARRSARPLPDAAVRCRRASPRLTSRCCAPGSLRRAPPGRQAAGGSSEARSRAAGDPQESRWGRRCRYRATGG